MKILILGGGGREHALAWKLRQSPRVTEVYCAPGNGGISELATCVPLQITEPELLVAFAKEHSVDLTVVGPDDALAAGSVDRFQTAGLRIFGPVQAAARLESSKVFAKEFMQRHGIPTAQSGHFSDPVQAQAFAAAMPLPVVVKADGLAAGKGVFVCDDRAAALAALDSLGGDEQFAGATKGILIEERLDGVEVSVMAITDGRTIVTLPPLQDHKAAHDGDSGPNTGGMGAYCPAPFVDAAMLADIEARILVPTAHAMRRAKVPFHGVLYAGLMLTAQGPKVLEFNARFGDPECEALMIRLESSLLELFDAAVDRRLDMVEPPRWRAGASVTVVMASEGYPGAVQRGRAIRGLDAAARVPDVEVFHAATRTADGSVLSDGGRVLAVTAVGPSLARAKLQAYSAVKEIRWLGAWCRKDISDKGLAHEREQLAAEAAAVGAVGEPAEPAVEKPA